MKLSAFWLDAAENWFTQMDVQFAIHNISVSKTKFFLKRLLNRSWTLSKPLQPEILMKFSKREYQHFKALVSLTLSGDQKPWHLMNRMLALLPDDYKPDFILRGLFLWRLPINVHSHLLREKVSDPCSLALKANKLYQSRISLSLMDLLSEERNESL